ncbi:hypothetical protein DFS34DRAFT_650072 [Phlyctochytrium arcticum]|nr:hypothetical protein DFS34DRAFT_650072 [Phlyctochytrium arcticum]
MTSRTVCATEETKLDEIVPTASSAVASASSKEKKRKKTVERMGRSSSLGNLNLHLDNRLQPVTKLEYADEERINKLLKSPLLSPKDRGLLTSYKKQRKKKDFFEVRYNYKQPSHFGRLYANDGERALVGHQCLSKDIRKYITNGYYADIDVVNCQPTIIKFLFKVLKLKCPVDVADRAAVLRENGVTDKKIVNRYLNKKKDNAPYPFLKNIPQESLRRTHTPTPRVRTVQTPTEMDRRFR